MASNSENPSKSYDIIEGAKQMSNSVSDWFNSLSSSSSSKRSDDEDSSEQNDNHSGKFQVLEDNSAPGIKHVSQVQNNSPLSKEPEKSKTLWDKVSSTLTNGISSQKNDDCNPKSAEIKVTTSPLSTSASSFPSKPLQEAHTGEEEQHVNFIPEYDRVINNNNSSTTSSLPARISTKSASPFSCVVGTMQTFGALSTRLITQGSSEKFNGVNSTPLLTVTTAGRLNEDSASSTNEGSKIVSI